MWNCVILFYIILFYKLCYTILYYSKHVIKIFESFMNVSDSFIQNILPLILKNLQICYNKILKKRFAKFKKFLKLN